LRAWRSDGRSKRIGKYELEEFLGGGMSHVYQGA